MNLLKSIVQPARINLFAVPQRYEYFSEKLTSINLFLFLSSTLFDVQNVWGRTAVDTQKPVDTSPLTEMPRQDVCAFVLFR